MSWRPIIFTNVYYTDCFFIGDVKVSLPTSIANQFKAETITYGSNITISLFNNLASLNLENDTASLISVLNELDNNPEKDLQSSKLMYSTNDKDYLISNVEINANTSEETFDYFDETFINFGEYEDDFPVKFASLFTFVNTKDTSSATIQFYHDPDDSDHVVGKVASGSYYDNEELSNFKCVLSSDSVLEVYYASDPRALNVTTTLESFQASETNSGTVFTVKFHSALVNGVFYPCRSVTDVRAVNELVSDTTEIYTKSGNTITPINGWEITPTDLYVEEE